MVSKTKHPYYYPTIMDYIYKETAQGRVLTDICSDARMPKAGTLRNLMKRVPLFREKYKAIRKSAKQQMKNNV